MIRILIKPAKRWFGGRRQWKFEIRGANGERIDARDTYANWRDISDFWREFILRDEVEIVLYDKTGVNVAERVTLR